MDTFELKDDEFELFRALIYKVCGISLSAAKKQLVKSRLQKRLKANNLESYRAYYDLVISLGNSSHEMTELVNCITTNKTDFFREAHHFEYIQNHIVPEMIQKAGRFEIPSTLKIWHAGCSTGEEPYTLAITLAEALRDHKDWQISQLASDIDTDVLAHAEAGIYDRERVEPVPSNLLRKYFLKGKEEPYTSVRVREELRNQITFRKINLLEDLWPIRSDIQFDIIFCRNVVIYFDKPTQKKLFAKFVLRLKPGGYLFIGHSESLLGVSDSFDSLGKTIYRLPDTTHQLKRAA